MKSKKMAKAKGEKRKTAGGVKDDESRIGSRWHGCISWKKKHRTAWEIFIRWRRLVCLFGAIAVRRYESL